MANIEYRALFQCTSGLTDLLQHNLSVSDKLLEKGLITMDVHDYILTAQGVSNQQKASRLVSCLSDRVKDAAQMFHDLVALLKEDPFFADIVEKINIEHSMSRQALIASTSRSTAQCSSMLLSFSGTLLENNKPCDSGKDEKGKLYIGQASRWGSPLYLPRPLSYNKTFLLYLSLIPSLAIYSYS